MGSAASMFNKSDIISSECRKFVDCFDGLAEKNKRGKACRVQAWRALDKNGNGYVSLAETGGWIKDSLEDFLEDKEMANIVYKSFYPSYIRSFKDAADASSDRQVSKEASTDDYVQKHEFRLLCAYLCIYAVMFDHFAMIDGYGAGKGADGVGVEDKNDDRRVSPHEWEKASKKFKKSPFVCLRVCALKTTNVFKEMDADAKGMVLLKEFCDYIKEGEIELGTEMGDVLAVDKV